MREVNFISCRIGVVKQPPVVGRAGDDELIWIGIQFGIFTPQLAFTNKQSGEFTKDEEKKINL